MPLKTRPFDPADYLYDEEDLALYLEDARAFGPEAVADAVKVVARARLRAVPADIAVPVSGAAEPAPPPFRQD